MRLDDLLEVIREDTPLTLEVHNQNGYEGTYKFDIARDKSVINPTFASAIVAKIELVGKRINIVIKR